MSDAKTRTGVVVGAGPAGYPAAFRAADLGLEVTLVDMEARPGGVCLHRGCIPSKSLLHAARLVTEAREGADIGIHFEAPRIDLDQLRTWKDGVIDRLSGGLEKLARGRGIRTVQGRGTFIDAHHLRVERTEGGEEEIEFEQALITTGSRPQQIDLFASAGERLLDSTSALALKEIPGRLLVVGGGAIGLELGSVYAALGSKVTVVELMPTLLPGCDAALLRPLEKRLRASMAAIYTATKVTQVTPVKDGVRVTFAPEEGKESQETFDALLLSVGRKPNSDRLGLEQAGVEIDARGFIRVDEAQRTTARHLFAAGDVVGHPMLAHKGTHEGLVAAEGMAGKRRAFEPRCIPAVVYTDPEVAWAGLTEGEAAKKAIAHRVLRFPWTASGRALSMDRTDGVTQLIVDPESGWILGGGITGVGAGDLIGEICLAMEMGATAADVALTIHPHPTSSESIMEAAAVFIGRAAHAPKK